MRNCDSCEHFIVEEDGTCGCEVWECDKEDDKERLQEVENDD